MRSTSPKEITPPPVRIDMENPRLRAWVESAFEQEIQALAQAGKGGRNEQLNRTAFAVYQLVAAGWIKDEHAHAALLDAAAACGLLKDDGRKQVLATLASGKRGGLAQPRQAPEEFARDDEDAALGAEIARRLVKSADGTLHDADTGEVMDDPPPPVATDGWPDFNPATIFSPPPRSPDLSARCPWRRVGRMGLAAARTVSAPVDYIATAFLTLAGGVLGNARWAEAPSGWTEPPILWTALVGDPSAGKSPAMSRATALADQIEAELAKRHDEALKDYASRAVIAKLANEVWQAQVRAALKNTPGVPPAGMPPEAAEPTKPLRAQLVISDATIEKLAHLAVGNIVSERVSDTLPRGVVNRLHWLPMTEDAIGNPDAVKVPLAPGANNELEAFGQRILERSRTVSGGFQGTLGKARGHALRLSCILEHIWWAAQPGRHPAPAAISANALECAVGLMEGYFLPMAERVFGDAVKPAVEKAEHRLAMHLKTERIDRLNARDLRRTLGGSLQAGRNGCRL